MITPEQLRERLSGAVIAMTTHFKDDLSVDLDGMRRLTEYYVDQQVPTVIVTGSTGEFFSLTDEERKQVQKVVIDTARGSDMTVIAGTSHSGSRQAVELTHYAEEIGADGVMITPPYYGTNGGGFPVIQNHYDYITSKIDIGVVVYFSGAVMWQVQDVIANPGKMKELIASCNGRAAGFKDASGNFGFYRDVSELIGTDVSVMGSAGMNYYFWGQRFGSRCCLTGLGNIWPKWEMRFCDLMEQGRYDDAEKIVKGQDLPYLRATKATGRYWACVKALQEMVGLPGGPMRAPLVDCTPAQRAELKRVCEACGMFEQVGAAVA